ncbi:MAG TPA: phosphoribosylanthranilate isomerase [Phycisphaerales bacterium]
MPRTRIKICGVRDEEAALAAVDAGADAVGFMFVRSSVRYIEPEEAAVLMSMLPPMVASVGVYMNMPIDAFSDAEEQCPTTHTQLHGEEDDELIASCAPVIKAIRFSPATIAADLRRLDENESVEAILIDGPSPGAGVPFQWTDLKPHLETIAKPVFLAGGLTPENVGEAIRTLRPYGVDVSSGVERERGVKDPALIEAFCDAVRRADLED